MKEEMLIPHGWQPLETPKTSLGFSHPDTNHVALVRRQYSSLRELPILRTLAEPADDPWQFALVDNDVQDMVEERTFQSKVEAREHLQSFLANNPAE